MEHTAAPRYQQQVDTLTPRTFDRLEIRTSQPCSRQSYSSDRSGLSENDSSDADSEFENNYTTSTSRPSVPQNFDLYCEYLRRDFTHVSTERSCSSISVHKAHGAAQITTGKSQSKDASLADPRTRRTPHLSSKDTMPILSLPPEVRGPLVSVMKASHTLISAKSRTAEFHYIAATGRSVVVDHVLHGPLIQDVAASRGKGPVVNHYSQPERRQDVESVLATADKAFDLGNTPGTSKSSIESVERFLLPVANQSTKLGEDQSRLANSLPTEPQNVVKDNDGHNRSECADGNEDGSHYTQHGRVNGFGLGSSQGSAMGQGSNLDRDMGGLGPHDDPNPDPQETPATHDLPGTEIEREFPCVYHNPGNPQADPMPQCKTLHKFVSHLRVHHSANKHPFYYCSKCFEKLRGEKHRKLHADKCKGDKCVTEECSNFDTFETSTCNHSGKGKKNSQYSKWRALFRLARPREEIPNLGIRESHGDNTNAVDPTTPAHSNVMSIGNSPQVPSSSSEDFAVSLTSTRTPSSNTCQRQLETLATSLLCQIDSPAHDRLEILENMYYIWIDHDCFEPVAPCQPTSKAPTMNGLKYLNRKLWDVVQRPGHASSECIQTLRVLVHGILPVQQSPIISPVASPAMQEISHDDHSPTAAAAGRAKNKHRQFSPTNMLHWEQGANEIDHTMMGYNNPEVAQYFDFQLSNPSFDLGPQRFVDPRQMGQTSGPAGSANAAIIFPWTHHDSAAALPTPGHAHGKRGTTDSAYGTGSFEGGFRH